MYALKHIISNKELSKCIHIFCVYVLGRWIGVFDMLFDSSNFTFIQSISQGKNASDIVITALATTFHFKLESNISFIYVSRDHFVEDLEKIFPQRNSNVVKSIEELDLLLK